MEKSIFICPAERELASIGPGRHLLLEHEWERIQIEKSVEKVGLVAFDKVKLYKERSSATLVIYAHI